MVHIQTLVNALNDYNLTKIEKLQILNIRPESEAVARCVGVERVEMSALSVPRHSNTSSTLTAPLPHEHYS